MYFENCRKIKTETILLPSLSSFLNYIKILKCTVPLSGTNTRANLPPSELVRKKEDFVILTPGCCAIG
jgi:hypothetical protein